MIIDEAVIDSLIEQPMPDMVYFRNRVAHLVRQDFDRRYFVDYISTDPVIPGTRLRSVIARIHRDVVIDMARTQDDRVRQKLGWMLNYIMQVNQELKSDGDRRTTHAEPHFSDVFFRSDETLQSYVEEVTSKRASPGRQEGSGEANDIA